MDVFCLTMPCTAMRVVVSTESAPRQARGVVRRLQILNIGAVPLQARCLFHCDSAAFSRGALRSAAAQSVSFAQPFHLRCQPSGTPISEAHYIELPALTACISLLEARLDVQVWLPCNYCAHPPTSAPGQGPPLPHLHSNLAHLHHIWYRGRTRLSAPTRSPICVCRCPGRCR